jgi:hypothetical protein
VLDDAIGCIYIVVASVGLTSGCTMIGVGVAVCCRYIDILPLFYHLYFINLVLQLLLQLLTC